MINIQSPSSRTHLPTIMSTKNLSLWKILSETWRIITSHPRHFLALSALFLLPLSITSVAYIFLVPQPNSLHALYPQSLYSTSTPYTENPPVPKPQLLISILMTLSSVFFSLCAIPPISYSTFAAFHDEPVILARSLRTILTSFFPLLATLIAKQAILGLISFAFLVLMLVAYSVLTMYGLESPYFLVFSITATVFLLMVMFYLSINWCLSNAVVVLESSWGFAPLRRSSYLVKGTRKVALSTLMLPLVLGGLMAVWSFNLAANAGGVSKVWIFAQMVVYVVLSTALSLYGLAATTVLYIYCKASHGEMALPIDETEYVLVPIA